MSVAKPDSRMPDLSGSVIVLTHARTGSSLLMQTLRLLGADVIGAFARPDLPQAANPKGYFEDLDLLKQGLTAPAVTTDPGQLRGRAVKLALRPLVNRRLKHEWTTLLRPSPILLVPIRHPAESLVSRQVFMQSDDAHARSALFLWSARNRLLDFGLLAERLGAPDCVRPAPVCIDYRQAIENPTAYVAGVVTAARLHPSSAQVAAAVSNVDLDLYRVRQADPRAAAAAAALRPLERIYDLLRSDDSDKWSRLRDDLPAWIREAGRAPLLGQAIERR